MATLRSFRGVGGAQMIRHGARGYFVGGKIVAQGEREIKMYWSARERNLSLDGQPVKKLADYFGALRTVWTTNTFFNSLRQIKTPSKTAPTRIGSADQASRPNPSSLVWNVSA